MTLLIVSLSGYEVKDFVEERVWEVGLLAKMNEESTVEARMPERRAFSPDENYNERNEVGTFCKPIMTSYTPACR